MFWAKVGGKIEYKGQKLIIKKKGLFMPKNKLGLSLSRKKGFFGPKIGGKLRIRSRN